MNKRIQKAFIIKQYSKSEGPILKGNGFDGLKIGDNRDEAQEFIDFINTLHLAALPKWSKPCETCGGRGYMPGTFGDSNLIIDSSDPCPDCTNGHQFIYRTPEQYKIDTDGEEWVGVIWIHDKLDIGGWRLLPYMQEHHAMKGYTVLCAATPAPPSTWRPE